jgi:hypothetical protein
VPPSCAVGAAWDDAMVARWSANPLGMLRRGTDAKFPTSGADASGTIEESRMF